MEQGRTEIRIAGFGGQGVVLAGIVLGRAAMLDGRQVVQNQSYGAEARGGAARSELVVADEPILYPDVLTPDAMLVMSQVACAKYVGDLAPEGALVIETELVTDVPPTLQQAAVGGPFTNIAEAECGRALVANMVGLGCFIAHTGLVSRESLEQAVRETVPDGTDELNLQALAAGWTLAHEPAGTT